ncbi:GYDIA family GHMP kinase [Aureibaculum sp. 2210JD6-5]|uniref:GYDIA family GHMP kinase n=1 Tax=Aureibaculum sp. 2210JD6-5 TaxID=3103957 RepID=UPI002AAE5BD1|nr:GYDIA family GHMP kinase [Aureibaculum sp. 2210JD6-5]MDY7396831.1 GYDIA family GHMP kinase [Aureibaculum sp. 2210JD6-5]
METFYSNGKLLLTGEYLVLDGAKALALPTKYGQNLTVQKIKEDKLVWESYTDQNELWLQVEFDLPRLRIISATFDSKKDGGGDLLAEKLREILISAKKSNINFLTESTGFYVKSTLDFPRKWGLGTSSTLINNIAQWAKVDAFQLQFDNFGGSGYDIACAQNISPITYQLKGKKPIVEATNFNPDFKEQLYFVYLNKKQNSREGIATYRNFMGDINTSIEEISYLTNQIIKSKTLSDFEKLLVEHEMIISNIIQQTPVQQQLFSDYFGQTKSLGAWGGDFILATGNDDTPSYFKNKGFKTVIPYQEMIL